MNFIDILTKDNIPTDSYLTAIQYIIEREERNGKPTDKEYQLKVIELTGFGGVGNTLLEHGMAEYTYKYVVQESIRAYADTQNPVNMAEMYTYAVDKARVFLNNNPHKSTPEPTEVITTDGTVKKKRGAKREMTCKLWAEKKHLNLSRKEWMHILITEVNMTKSGASTYYAKLLNGTFGC